MTHVHEKTRDMRELVADVVKELREQVADVVR
jgi:hypothetical protein